MHTISSEGNILDRKVAFCGNKMRLLHVIDTADTRSGGPIQGLKVAAIRQQRGVDATVISLDPDEFDDLAVLPFETHGLGQKHLINLFAPNFRYSSSMVPWIRENAHRFDAVIVHGIWCYHTIAVHTALKGTSIPYVVYTHGMMDPWFKNAYPLKHIKKQIYWWLFLGRALRDAALILFTAEDEKLLARGVFLGYRKYKERVVKYGTVDAPNNIDEQNAAFQERFPEMAGRRYLLFLSRIDPKKGCDLLISAFASIAERYPNLDLIMAGPDKTNWRPHLEALARSMGISSRIHWPGMLSGDVKWGAFRNAEAFVLPSHQENFGIAVAEALSCGLPVLISRRINIWREIDAAGAGLISEDTQAGTIKLLQTFVDLSQDRRKEMGEKARGIFLDRFNIDTNSMELIEILNEYVIVRKKTP